MNIVLMSGVVFICYRSLLAERNAVVSIDHSQKHRFCATAHNVIRIGEAMVEESDAKVAYNLV